MRAKHVGEARGDLDHQIGSIAVKAIDPLREIERFLYGPDLLMPIRRQYPGWISDSDPADRNDGSGFQPRPDMHRGAHADFHPFAHLGTMKVRGTRRDEDLRLNISARH